MWNGTRVEMTSEHFFSNIRNSLQFKFNLLEVENIRKTKQFFLEILFFVCIEGQMCTAIPKRKETNSKNKIQGKTKCFFGRRTMSFVATSNTFNLRTYIKKNPFACFSLEDFFVSYHKKCTDVSDKQLYNSSDLKMYMNSGSLK